MPLRRPDAYATVQISPYVYVTLLRSCQLLNTVTIPSPHCNHSPLYAT